MHSRLRQFCNDGKNGTSQSLITAIQRNNPEIVKALLEKGANPNLDNGSILIASFISVRNPYKTSLLLRPTH